MYDGESTWNELEDTCGQAESFRWGWLVPDGDRMNEVIQDLIKNLCDKYDNPVYTE